MNEAARPAQRAPGPQQATRPTRNRSTALWIAGAFATCTGPGPSRCSPRWAQGSGARTRQATARQSFVLFWPAYCPGALAALFGPSFQTWRRRVREFGRAFCGRALRAPRVGRLAHLQVMRPRATPSSSLVAPLRAPICLRFFGGSPAARARSQRLVAPAHRRPELHHFRVCSGFLQASRFCERQVSDGVFAVCASLRGGSGAEGDGVRPARPHIRRQAVALGPFKPLTLPSRLKPQPPDRSIGCA